MKMKRRGFIKNSLGLTALGALGGSLFGPSKGKTEELEQEETCGSGKKIVWKLQTYAGESLGQHVIRRSIDAFNKAADGRMEIKLYYADQLVPSKDILYALKNGDLDSVQIDDTALGKDIDISVFSGYFPLACQYSLDVPVLFNDWGLDAIWQDAYRNLPGVTWLGTGAWDPCHFSTKNKIGSVDDLAGLRICTFPVMGRFLSRFGVSVQNLESNEIIPALQHNGLDGVAWSGITEVYTMDWYKYLNYFLTNSLSNAWFGSYFANTKRWLALPESLKELFKMAMDSSHYYRNHWYWGGETRLRVTGGGRSKKLELSVLPEKDWNIIESEADSFWDEIAGMSDRNRKVIDILREYRSMYLRSGGR
ncbi:MAG: hypothetical protein OXB84_08240 [Halobacteriovoraceae bacterium]|nr:hypothetical protein [Halobacteriovoraceae bacterium]